MVQVAFFNCDRVPLAIFRAAVFTIANRERIAITANRYGNIQSLRIRKSLLNAIANVMLVVLRLYHGNRHIRLVIENDIRTLLLPAHDGLALHKNSTVCERNLFANLRIKTPPSIRYAGQNELADNVAFGEVFLIHFHGKPCLQIYIKNGVRNIRN